jgi:MFS family permease
MSATEASDPVDRAALQRRTLRVLTVGQLVGAAALASAVTVGAFVVQGILGQETPWAGLATATVTTGTAFMSALLARRMARHGRRPGLQLGYGLAVVGGLVAGLGAEWEQLIVFLPGLFLYGSGQAANLLARYAATDLAEPQERSRAMSRIVFASTFGAVLGPLLIGPAEAAGQEWFGLQKYTGPWLFSTVFFLGAMVNTAVRLRPDPLVVAGGTAAGASGPGRPSVRSAVGVIGADPMARPAGDGDLPGHDGGRHGDDPRAPEAPRSRGGQPVRGVDPHRRDVRLQPAGGSLLGPTGPSPGHPARQSGPRGLHGAGGGVG